MPRKGPKGSAEVVAFPQAPSGQNVQPARRATPPAKARRDFAFPEKRPSANAMLDALGVSHEEGFGFSGIWTAQRLALTLETDLFNAWVKLQARTLGLREPGTLSHKQFQERYW